MVLGIFWHDLKRLLVNPFARIVVLGLIVLSSACAWYSISAMWDPYANADRIKVAVVSEDVGAPVPQKTASQLSSLLNQASDSDNSGEDASIEEAPGKSDASGDVASGDANDRVDDGSPESGDSQLGAGGQPEAGRSGVLIDFDGTTLNIGNTIVSALKRDHSFDWQFVGADQGKSGLESGEYYAEFVIPESFSADFLSILSDDAERPEIEFWTNGKYDAEALGATVGGADLVTASVDSAFAGSLADVTAEVVKGIADDLADSDVTVDSTAQANLKTATTNLAAVAGELVKAEKSLDKWDETVASVQGSIESLKAGLPGLRTSVNDGITLLEGVRSTAHEVANAYSSALTTGSEELPKAMEKASARIKSIAGTITSKRKEIGTSIGEAEDSLENIADLIEALRQLGVDSGKLAELEQETENALDELSKLENASAAVDDAAQDAVSAANSAASDIEDSISELQSQDEAFDTDVLPQLDSSLDSLALIIGSLDSAIGYLDAQADQAKTLLEQLGEVIFQTKDVAESTSGSLDAARQSLQSAQSDLASLDDTNIATKMSSLVGINAKSYESSTASAVAAEVRPVYTLGSYGAGVTPFFTNLAIWMGCFFLVAVLKREVDPKAYPRMRSWHGYLGRLLLLVLLALLQGVVVSAGDIALGAQPIAPASFIVASLFTSFCFISVVYALAVTFKHIGKALAAILLVAQVPIAAGTYPIQLMPEFFQALYQWLPFTYGMGAMREAIAGFYGNAYLDCLVWLLVCGVAATVLALVVRPLMLSLNRLFDRKLRFADVFVSGGSGTDTGFEDGHFATGAVDESGESRDALLDEAASFANRYSVAKQLTPVVIVVLIVALGVWGTLASPGSDGKLVGLLVFIAVLALVFCICVGLEFAYDSLVGELREYGFDRAEMRADRPMSAIMESGAVDVAGVASVANVANVTDGVDVGTGAVAGKGLSGDKREGGNANKDADKNESGKKGESKSESKADGKKKNANHGKTGRKGKNAARKPGSTTDSPADAHGKAVPEDDWALEDTGLEDIEPWSADTWVTGKWDEIDVADIKEPSDSDDADGEGDRA